MLTSYQKKHIFLQKILDETTNNCCLIISFYVYSIFTCSICIPLIVDISTILLYSFGPEVAKGVF